MRILREPYRLLSAMAAFLVLLPFFYTSQAAAFSFSSSRRTWPAQPVDWTIEKQQQLLDWLPSSHRTLIKAGSAHISLFSERASVGGGGNRCYSFTSNDPDIPLIVEFQELGSNSVPVRVTGNFTYTIVAQSWCSTSNYTPSGNQYTQGVNTTLSIENSQYMNLLGAIACTGNVTFSYSSSYQALTDPPASQHQCEDMPAVPASYLPDPPSQPTTPNTNAELAYELFAKGAALALASFVGYIIVRQFRWRGTA